VLVFAEDLLPEHLEIYEEEHELDGFDSYSDFEGEAYKLSSDSDNNSWDEIDENLWNESFLFGCLEHGPSIYKHKAHYTSYDQIKQELISTYGKFVIKDFPWENRIVKLSGTIFG
jgi:hypothetical protein